MPTYTDNLHLTKITPGEGVGTWGATLNSILDILDTSVSSVAYTMDDENTVINLADGGTAQSQYMFITINGALTANRTLTFTPDNEIRCAFIRNATTGGFDLTVDLVDVPPGYTVFMDNLKSSILNKMLLDEAMFANGSAAEPAIIFEADRDTGIYRNTVTTPGIGFSVGGVTAGVVDGNGFVVAEGGRYTLDGPAGDSYISKNASHTLRVVIENTERMFLTTAGNMVVDGYLSSGSYLELLDGVSEPAPGSGKAAIYVDTADGDLKVKFADGTVKTIVVDT